MRALVLGARGAVGRVVVAELRRRGHEVTPAGRTAPPDGVAVDLTRPADDAARRALARAVEGHDVLVNAAGVESTVVAAAGAPVLVDISATSSYLAALREAAPAAATVVLGAGLAPGLSTVLVAALDVRPDDEIDVGVLLGTAERHGDAAVQWTADLVGAPVHAPPEGGRVLNLRDRRRLTGPDGRTRTYLRADFPDHVLVGERLGVAIRSHLTLSSRAATVALGLAARTGAGGLLRHSPHVGSAAWQVVAVNRRTGQALGASGTGQSHATGVLTVLAAERAVARPARGPVTMADLVDRTEALDRLAPGSAPQHR
ncbi:NAD-dependent epimerase/dehydratase family protein [Nocardioides sp. WV_118_6]